MRIAFKKIHNLEMAESLVEQANFGVRHVITNGEAKDAVCSSGRTKKVE